MLDRQQQKQLISAECFKELEQNGLLKNRRVTMWSTKTSGAVKGVVLTQERKTKNEKRTYAKFISYKTEQNMKLFNDFFIITAARHCGIAAPKVKMVTNGKLFYQFSRDLTDTRDNTSFFTLLQLKKQLDTSNNRKDITYNNESYQIDYSSLARLAVGVVVFNLSDLHNANIGVIFDHTTKTAKIAFVDSSEIPSPPLDAYRKSDSLAEFICMFNTTINNSGLVKFGLSTLTDADFKNALSEISKNMESACQFIADYKVNMRLPESLRNVHIDNLIERWKRNLEILNLFALNPALARMIP